MIKLAKACFIVAALGCATGCAIKSQSVETASCEAKPGPGKTSTPPGFTDNMDEALAKAKAEGKLIYACFTGSDWCMWCRVLEGEILSKPEFVAGATNDFVLVFIDSPEDESLLSEHAKVANPKLVEKYNIEGFPTALILDADGKKIGRMRSREGGVKGYVERLLMYSPNASGNASDRPPSNHWSCSNPSRGLNYKFDASAAPELAVWMRTKLMPTVVEWYPKMVEMFSCEGCEVPKEITFKFFDDESGRNVAGTDGSSNMLFNRTWVHDCPDDLEEPINAIVWGIVTGKYPNGPEWLHLGISRYFAVYHYERTLHGDIEEPDLTSDWATYNSFESPLYSASFLNFVEKKHPGTVRELHALCSQGKYDEATYWRKRTGKDVFELEREWNNHSDKESQFVQTNLTNEPFSRYRFCVDCTKGPANSVQLSEFELLDADGKVIPASKFKLGFDDSGDDVKFGPGETPDKAIDGDLGTKWLDFRAGCGRSEASRSAVWLQFDFAEPTKLSGYRWYSANDYEGRDPRNWRLLGSNDGVNWVEVDVVRNFRALSDRNKLACSRAFFATAEGQKKDTICPELAAVVVSVRDDDGAMVTMPTLQARFGEQDVKKYVTEYHYPTKYDVVVVETNGVYKAVVEPRDWTMREVGIICKGTPTLVDGKIDLDFDFELVDEPSWTNYGGTMTASDGTKSDLEMEQPTFPVKSVKRRLLLVPGEATKFEDSSLTFEIKARICSDK